ncbi:MAG: hypothetical protein K5683_03255 [Prevotella sp.]|nr:hypothetical protein [Prevotella sp.]
MAKKGSATSCVREIADAETSDGGCSEGERAVAHATRCSEGSQSRILVGQNLKKGMVLNSSIWLKRLKDRIVAAKDKGEPVWITIR